MATILVVDDSPVMQRLLTLMLERNEHEVIAAGNGREATTYLEQRRVDLIITDVNMPEMDGLTLLQQLRANSRHKDLPVVVLTASSQEGIRRIAAQRGANGFLTRPTSSWELKEIVNHCLPGVDPPSDGEEFARQT
jgi:two-component system, chemotaxis family, chemotaxis protein CheY